MWRLAVLQFAFIFLCVTNVRATTSSTSKPNVVVVLLGGVPASMLYTADTHAMSGTNAPFYAANLRFLERNSVTFLNAYVNVARSSPSRNSLLTSLHPRRQIGILSDASAGTSTTFQQDRQTVFSSWLRSATVGMQSVGAGRIFKLAPATITYGGFQQYAIPRGGDQDNICGDNSVVCVFDNELTLTDDDVAERAVSYLRTFARTQQPFSLVVGFHRAYGDKSFPTWAQTQIDKRRAAVLAQLQDSSSALQTNPLFTVNAPKKLTLAQANDYKMATFSSIQWVDFCLGKIIDELRGLRFWDNTILIVTSDAAQASGEFSDMSTDGSSVYEHTTRVPLYVRDPRSPKSFGRQSAARVELVDLATTVYDLVGARFPPNGGSTSFYKLQGTSLKGLIDLYQKDSRAEFTSNVYFNISTRFAAYSESARCTKSSAPFNGLPAGSLIPNTVQWSDCFDLGTRVDVLAISMRTSTHRYTEYRAVLNNQPIWETDGLYARELFSHEKDTGLEQSADGNGFELENLAQCTECTMTVPPSPKPISGNPSISLPGDTKAKEFYTAPSLLLNAQTARLVRAYALTLRSMARDGVALCSNHGLVNPDNGECEFCDNGWEGPKCEFSSLIVLNPGESGTSSPTVSPPPTTRPPVGAPTLPGSVTSAPTPKSTANPTPKPTGNPTPAPTPQPTNSPVEGGDCTAFTTKATCTASFNCAWNNQKCKPVTPAPTISLAQSSCEGVKAESVCQKINGCIWQGKTGGCQTPYPAACGCEARMDVVNAFVPSDRASGAGEWQLFRNTCHALCRGAVPPTTQPTGRPTLPTQSPTTPRPTLPRGLPFPDIPGTGNAVPVDTLTLYLVLDASMNIAEFNQNCIKTRGFGCLHISAIFFVKLLDVLDDYVKQGWSAFRVGVFAYSCQDRNPLWVEIRAPFSGEDVTNALRKVKDSISPRGGRCPSKVFSVIRDYDQGERVLSPNRAMIFLLSGIVTTTDLEEAETNARLLREDGVATLGIVVTRPDGKSQTPQLRVTQSRTEALAITGHMERVFIASPEQGVLALVSMVDAVAAAVLALMNEPSRVAGSSSEPPSDDFLTTEGYEDPELNPSNSATVAAGVSTFVLFTALGAFVIYRKRSAIEEYIRKYIKNGSSSTDSDSRSGDIVVSTQEVFEVGRASPVKTARRRSSLDLAQAKDGAGGKSTLPLFSLARKHQQMAQDLNSASFDAPENKA